MKTIVDGSVHELFTGNWHAERSQAGTKLLNLEIAVLIINAASTWFMTGLIWFVQIVHYPLFEAVGAAEFQTYAERHRALTSLVVAGPMLIEIFTALVLAVIWKRSDATLIWVALALVFGIWICTVLFSIPSHEKFCATGYSESTLRWLVSTNWIRTSLWTARAAILALIIYRQLLKSSST